MSDQPHTLIRPGIDAARGEYDRRRGAELLARKRHLRDEELERLARRVDVIDLELAGLAQIRARELAVDLSRHGFDTTSLRPLSLPTEAERQARRHRGRADLDAATRARQEEAFARVRSALVRHYTPEIRVR